MAKRAKTGTADPVERVRARQERFRSNAAGPHASDPRRKGTRAAAKRRALSDY